MHHIIIIPHANREDHLRICLRFLGRAIDKAKLTSEDIEVLIVGTLADDFDLPSFCQFISTKTTPPLNLRNNEHPPFWKTNLLATGRDYVLRGEMTFNGNAWLTYLDADMLAHEDFFVDGFRGDCDEQAVERAAHIGRRIRFVNYNWAENADGYPADYESLPADYEVPGVGNSCFSCPAHLGLEWDTRYWGRGFHDLDYLRRVSGSDSLKYREPIVLDRREPIVFLTKPPGALLAIKHDLTPGFTNDRWADRNKRFYYGTRTVWALFDNVSDREKAKQLLRSSGTRCLLKEDYDFQERLSSDIVLDCTL